MIKVIAYFILLKGLVYGEVVLSPTSPGTTENNSLTLTCTFTGKETVTYTTWKKVKKNETLFNNIGIISSECKGIVQPIDTSLYEYSCPSNKQYTWKIKKVTRQNEGERYQCVIDTPSPGVINSNDVVVSVQVAITSVNLISHSSSTITVRENVDTVFKCKTSGGLPEANITWYKLGDISGQSENEVAIYSQITASSITVNGLVEVTSTLNYIPSRNESGWRIYCKARNIVGQALIVSTRKPKMNVEYPPDSPIIKGFMNNGEYRVIENTLGSLSCFITGGNPPPTLSWNCYNSGTLVEASSGTVTKGQTWMAVRGSDKNCTCSSSHYSGSKSVSINIIILYPPTAPTFKLHGTPVSGTVKVIRNHALSISCISSGKPQPSYTWTYSDSPNRPGQVLTINKIQSDKRLTCNVQNTMDPTGNVTVSRSNSSYIDVIVLYPPSTPRFNYWNTSGQSVPRSLDVIKDDTFKVACTSDGKPSPAYSWDKNGNNSILTITNIDTDKTSSVCTAINKMRVTVGNTVSGSATASLTINVQYPPTDVTFKYSNGDTLTRTLRVKEGKRFNVTCSSNSSPAPSYNWTGTVSSTSSILNVNSALKSHTGTITCNVANRMVRTFANPEKQKEVGVVKSLDLQILYPPIIGKLTNTSVAEGSPLTVSCPVTVGNPPKTTYQWLRDGAVWKSNQTFSVKTVTRTDAMFYTCKTSNTMEATGEESIISDVRKSFYLNVWYSATVKEFYISGHLGQTSVVKNEDDRLQFNCVVDSNPGSSLSLTFMEEELKKETDEKQLTYTIDSAQCTTRGNYSCEGFNRYNKNHSNKMIHLFINCSPRPSPSTALKENVTSAQHIPAVLTFTTLAYPETLHFKWYRWYSNLWQQISNNEEFQIDILNIQSNLTIKNVNRTYYGKYQLQVTNTIGNYTQPFYLDPEDVPDTPAEFRHIQEKVTKSSITVEWIPGFDNGPDQTFILKYKKSSDIEWMAVNITDTNEERMNYTLTALSSGTLYELILYASNRLGDSVKTDVLKIETKSEDKSPQNLGLIIGSVCGGLACAVLGILGFLFVRKFRNRAGKGKSNADNNERKNVYADDENDYGMQDNPMYVSAGPREEASGGSSEVGPVYSAVDKNRLVPDSNKNDVYAEVNKPKKTGPSYGKKERPEKGKHNFKKDIRGKKALQDGDIYENTSAADAKTKSKSNDETIYENPEPAKQKKNMNKDGLIYADLTFNDQPKGQKKLVIHGLDSMTEYVEVDFTRKADPLPDSDDENVPPK